MPEIYSRAPKISVYLFRQNDPLNADFRFSLDFGPASWKPFLEPGTTYPTLKICCFSIFYLFHNRIGLVLALPASCRILHFLYILHNLHNLHILHILHIFHILHILHNQTPIVILFLYLSLCLYLYFLRPPEMD